MLLVITVALVTLSRVLAEAPGCFRLLGKVLVTGESGDICAIASAARRAWRGWGRCFAAPIRSANRRNVAARLVHPSTR
jgi:hypothetical protein